jgi:hypothetical protein
MTCLQRCLSHMSLNVCELASFPTRPYRGGPVCPGDNGRPVRVITGLE